MLYRALFAISKPFRAAWWGVFVFTVMGFLACILGTLWMCGNPRQLFNICSSLPRPAFSRSRPAPLLTPAAVSCATPEAGTRLRAVIITGSTFNVLSDLAIMALPLGMVRQLRVRPAQRAGLAAVFAVGLLDVAFAVLRTVAHFTATVNSAFNVLEPVVAVVVCALPVYRTYLGGAAGSGGSGSWSKWWSVRREWFESRSWLGSSRSWFGSSRARTPEGWGDGLGYLGNEKPRAHFVSRALDSACSAGARSEMSTPEPPSPPPKAPWRSAWGRNGETDGREDPLNHGVSGVYYHAEATGPRLGV